MSISLSTLEEAISIKEQIAELESRLAAILGDESGEVAAPSPKALKKGRRKMSAAGRARIAAAQKLRWAKQKGTSVESPAKAIKKKK
jgi:hypothetical protein